MKALASVLSMPGFPSVTPCDQLGWDVFSWPSFHGLLLSWFLLSLSSCTWFFPMVFFTMPASFPLPSREAVHCYFMFFYLQTVVLHQRNLLFLPVLPSTVKSRHPPASQSLQGKYLHFLCNIRASEMISVGNYPSCKYFSIPQQSFINLVSSWKTGL